MSKLLSIKRMPPYYKADSFALYLGNSLELLKKFPENSIDMIFADPPYNLSNGGFSVHAGKRVSVNKKDDYNFHFKWLEACKKVLKLSVG